MRTSYETKSIFRCGTRNNTSSVVCYACSIGLLKRSRYFRTGSFKEIITSWQSVLLIRMRICMWMYRVALVFNIGAKFSLPYAVWKTLFCWACGRIDSTLQLSIHDDDKNVTKGSCIEHWKTITFQLFTWPVFNTGARRRHITKNLKSALSVTAHRTTQSNSIPGYLSTHLAIQIWHLAIQILNNQKIIAETWH